jgi:hypothetical protein
MGHVATLAAGIARLLGDHPSKFRHDFGTFRWEYLCQLFGARHARCKGRRINDSRRT